MVVPTVEMVIMLRFAIAVAFLIASETSAALPIPSPSLPCPSPATINAENLIVLPPLTTLVTRLMAISLLLMSSFSPCWNLFSLLAIGHSSD